MVSFACLSNIFGQEGLRVGLHGGFTSATIANQNNYGYTELDYLRTFGGAGGLLVGYNFNENWGGQVELNYAHTGQDYKDIVRDFGPLDENDKQIKIDTYRYIDLNYFMLPMMLSFQSTKEKKDVVEFYGAFGPALGFLLSASQSYEADTSYTNTVVPLDYSVVPESHIPEFAATSAVEDAKEYFSGIDFGFQLEAGLNIYATDNIVFTPAVKSYYGLTDINSKPTRESVVANYTYQGASHNFFFGLFVGAHILLGGD